MIKEELSDLDMAIYPIHGNHDTWPCNVQDFDKPYDNKAIDTFAKHWSGWLDKDAIKVYRKYGYYSTPMRLKDGT